MIDIIVLDNVLNNPEQVVVMAKREKFFSLEDYPMKNHKCSFKGYRTEMLAPNVSNSIINNCFESVFGNTDLYKYNNFKWSWKGQSFFHRLDKENVYDESWCHIDLNCSYAGIIYLNKNPENDKGTMIVKNGEKMFIENVYNRLVVYNSKYTHSSMGGFGMNDDSRLTFTMNFMEINISMAAALDS